jgi:uncharacterized membrane protein
MKIAMFASIVVLALAGACPQAAMAAQRQAGASVSGSASRSTSARGSSNALSGMTGGSGVTNPSGNSLINTSPSGSTLFPYGSTTGIGR